MPNIVKNLALLILAAALPLAAQQDDRYLVRLDPTAAIDRVDAIAMQLAATHGGTIVSTGSATDDTIVLRLPAGRAQALRSDPRVRAVRALKVAAEARVVEPVNWTAGVSYSYDGARSVTKIGNDTFAYDDVGRLVRATVNAVTRSYEYDAFGNRKKCTAPGTDCQYTLTIDSSTNRLVERTDIDHDAAGNVIELGPHVYSYDAANMMTKDHSTETNGPRYEYLYTAADERLATWDANNASWTWTLRDHAGQVVRELTSNAGGNWTWTRDYIHRDGQLLASRYAADGFVDTHHYHVDHLGTPRRVTDSTDLIVGYHDYHAFGPEVPGSLQEPGAGDRKYTGHEREPGDGQYTLDYMRARFYNISLGRFLSTDPVLDPRRAVPMPQGWNRYAYALNDPLSRFDPDGRKDTIFIVNTVHGGGFTPAQLNALNRAVAGTRFEGNIRVIGPMASNEAILRTIRGADSTDMVGLIFHSGRSSFHPNGNIFTQKKLDLSAKSGMIQGVLQGNDLAAAVNPKNPVGACVLAGCSSDQAALSMMTNANVLTFGTTNHTRLDELGNALVTILGEMAQGRSPQAAAGAASQHLTIKPDCRPSNDCDPTRPAQVQAVVPPK